MWQLLLRIKSSQKNNRFQTFSYSLVFLLAFLSLLPSNPAYTQTKKSFTTGEKLKYKVYYGFINGGEAVLEVRKGTYEGKQANHLYLNGKTVGIANSLYNVDDTYESYTDPETDWPYYSIRNIHENRYRHYSTQKWDHWSRKDSSIVISSKNGTSVVVKGCQDILSSFYYFRHILLKMPPQKDQLIVVDAYFTDEKFPLMLRFKGYENVKTKFGEVQCMKFMPVVQTGRVFKSKDDMTIWFSNDENCIPIRIRFEIFVGSVYCDLYEYSGLLNPFKSLKKKE